jgi:two-component system LytT family response regulator
VESRGKVRSVPVDEIDYIVQSGPYAELHTGGKRHLIREAMQTLEERLDPRRFMRVHRSMIVRLDLVETLHRGAGGDYEVQLKSGARVRVSRSRREALERWLGVSG